METIIYVGNLSHNTTKEALRELFGADGRQVTEVAIVTDRATGGPRGFAFVEMGSPAEVESAITALEGREVDGRTLKVSKARHRPRRG